MMKTRICRVLIQCLVVVVLSTINSINFLSAQPPSALPEAFEARQLLWEREFGIHQYTVPVLHDGQLFVGTDDAGLEHPVVETTGGGILHCLDPESGATIWQFPIPRYMEGRIPPFHFNHWRCGVCSTPALDENRAYIVGPRGDVLCFDRIGQADGNDGPFQDELAYMDVPTDSDYELTETDGDLIWQYDLIKELGVVPHDVCGSSPILLGDYLYACTSNGIDDRHGPVANPHAPALVVLEKTTGRLVATDGAVQGENIFHGNWSSPVAAEVDGKPIVLFGGGDGILYAFEPYSPPADGEEDSPVVLNTVWTCDCIPDDYRERDGEPIEYSKWSATKTDGPSEIIATPVVQDGKIYVSIGQSPVHKKGQGALSCVDVATGEMIWQSRDVDRSTADACFFNELLIGPSVRNGSELLDRSRVGLVFQPDYTGFLHCLDAETGETYWSHDLESGVWCSYAVVANGNVYISTERQLLSILKASREKEVVAECRVRSEAITPLVENGVMYFPTQRRLFAIELE
jgi:outer membrane protein assembly factor BamB